MARNVQNMRELEVAKQAARAGGEIVKRYFHDGVVMRANEQSYNLVSDADVESEQAIVDVIRQSFPNHAVLGEESHRDDTDAEHLWVIDPLDGTNNFAHHIPHFAISIAYYCGGQPACSLVYNPIRDDWYQAVRDQGAFYNSERASVADHDRLDQTLVGVGFYYDRGALMEATLKAIGDLFRSQIHGIRRFGTASLDLCQVGIGMYGAFFEYELSPWDFAAGSLFVQEAGGRVTTCCGEPLPLAKMSVLATNNRLHEAVLQVVRSQLPTP